MGNKKAFVCFCVDGKSDIDALRGPFEDIFDDVGGDDINVTFRFAEFCGENHGDITSLSGVNPGNIEMEFYKYYFRQQDKNSDLGWGDLTHIIHVIDLDGAFIQDRDIFEYTDQERKLAEEIGSNGNRKRVLYFGDHIAVEEDIYKMIDRNKRKRQNIEYLLSLEQLTARRKSVDYSLYYFSSNLDHFLYGNANLSGPDKMREAARFSDKYPFGDCFSKFLDQNEYATKDDYYNSWKNVKKGRNSLCRGTNLNLLLKRIKGSALSDWN